MRVSSQGSESTYPALGHGYRKTSTRILDAERITDIDWLGLAGVRYWAADQGSVEVAVVLRRVVFAGVGSAICRLR
jgi:hypothetical protein